MTVSTHEFLKGSYNATRMLGDKAVASDGTMVVSGFETISLLIKQFPWPTLSVAGEIEVPTPQGAALWQPQQLQINKQGPVALMETVIGQVADFQSAVIAQGGYFECTVYEGTPERFHRGYKLRNCFLQLDNPDRDWESRAQILLITGTMFFHFFNERIPGNIAL